MMTMEQMLAWLRPFAVKATTRLVLYGLVAWLGVSAATTDEIGPAIGEGLGAILALTVAVLLDRWHQREDRAAAAPVPQGRPPVDLKD